MMKSILCALLAIACVPAIAQSRFGITAGANLAKTVIRIGNSSGSTYSLLSFHAGLMEDISLSDDFYFQPQLLLSGKGARTDVAFAGNSTGGAKATVNPFYLELPLNFLYRSAAGSGQLSGGIGPYVAAGLFGKYKEPGYSETIKFGSGNGAYFKRFDLGINLLAEYELSNGFLVSANYSLGLINISPAGGSGYSMRNNYFGISVGYLLPASQ